MNNELNQQVLDLLKGKLGPSLAGVRDAVRQVLGREAAFQDDLVTAYAYAAYRMNESLADEYAATKAAELAAWSVNEGVTW